MSANSCDVSKIQDEDVLRKMWQETEDFGRKKEIRAHMYKVRESRLKDLYSTGTEAQTQVSVQKSSSKSSNVKTTHADSLADHSFLSLKSKEVRDSESPTRDVAFNNKINVAADKYGNTGWTITSSDDTSNDGKTHTAVRTATTSGTENIDKGISSYAAKAEQKASVCQDGDANNFTRAVGMSDASTIHQEASGGDEFSSFKTSSTSAKSSSKTVTESQSKSGDMVDYSIPKDTVRETRDHIIPANAKTAVYTETKTLPDGSKVTTTRYETRGGSSKTAATSSSSTTVQKSSSANQQSSSTSSEQRGNSQHITSSSGQQDKSQQLKGINYGVDTVDYKKAIKLSEDLSKNVNISDKASSKMVSSKSVQQETVRDSKYSEAKSSAQHDTKVKIQTQQDIIDKLICEVKPPQQIESRGKESSPPIRSAPSPVREEPKSPRKEPEPVKPYEQPERRQTVKPSKSELEVSSKATEGQYDTTYRSEFTNKKIHVEVSPTHDAFARSLRALTPEDLKSSSNRSLRSSQSPEKMRHPARVSPDRLYSAKSPKRYTSTEKYYEPRATTPKYSPERVTTYNTDTITKRKKVTDDGHSTTVRSSTLTRDTTSKDKVKSRSRSVSPTTTSSDFEFVSKSAQVSDLDKEDTTITRSTTRASKTVTEIVDARPSTLNYSKKSKKITERSPTSPLTDLLPSKRTPSPAKETTTNIRRTSVKEEQQQRQEKILRRTDTYEERCRQILGIPEKKKPERNVSDIINTDRRTYRISSRDKLTQEVTTRKPSLPDAARRPSKSPEKCAVNGYPDKKSPVKERPQVSEFPSQIRRSPERKSLDRLPEKQSPIKDKSTISEFPSQIRKSPQKLPLEKYPERKSPKKESPKISEVPAQIKRSPEREPSPCYPGRQSPAKEAPTISEFPSQIRKSPERQSLDIYPENTYHAKETPKISEFPSQIRRSPEREPLPEYTERKVSTKDAPKICEFPSQIRKTPDHEPLPKYPERQSPTREAPIISEFPSQIRRTPEREPLEKLPERKSPPKESPKIAEFPAQIRKTPEREPLPEYPEKNVPCKQATIICEFPSQIRKTPERESLPQYPEKQKEPKEPSKLSEFHSQTRRSPARDTITDNIVTKQELVTTKKKTKKLSEFPSQTNKTPKPTTEDKVLQETADYLYKDKIPIDEPMFTKKFIAELGSDDECEITVDEDGNTKINTIDDEELYIQETQNVSHKTEKKDSPERQFIREKLSQERDQTIKQQIDEFISTERNDIYRTTESRKSSPDLRRSPERGILKHTSQFDEKTEKTRIDTTSTKTTDDKIKTQIVEIKVETVKTKPKINYSTTKKPVVKDSSDTKIIITSAKTTKDLKELPDTKPKQPTLSKTPSIKSVPTRKMDTPTFSSKSAKTCYNIKLETITKSSSTDSKVSKKFVQKLPEPSTTSKRHVVTTTINVSPKISKESTTRTIKNITNTPTVQAKPKTITIPIKSAKTVSSAKKIDVENIENQERITQKKRIDKLVRTNNEPTVKSPSRTPTRVTSKPEVITKTADVKDKKCITTKTILINNMVADEREIIVDLLRSTSTREDQNTICPIPVKNNDGKGSPRYPDQVTEPDDFSVKHTPRKLSSTPIDEYEDVSDFTGVTEVTTEDVIKQETTQEIVDESLLSVNEKVSKFTNQRNKPRNLGPAPKVERPILIIDEKLESDECLLSVSEKVHKFVNKAEKLSIADSPERPKSPRCQNIVDITDIDENDESLMSVSDKVTHFVTTAENVKKPQTSTIKVEKTDLSFVDESLRTDECLLSVSDKVTKFITTAETLTTQKDAVTPKKPATLTQKQPLKTSDDLTEACITIETEEQTYTRQSPQRQTTPKNVDRTSPTRRASIKEERRTSRKDSSSTLIKKDSSTSITEIEITPKSSRPSTKPLLGGTTPLRSTESIRKAKLLFENMATGTENRELKRQKVIHNRPSVFDAKKKPETITRRLTPDRDDVKLKDIGIKESTTASSNTHPSTDIRRKLSFPSDDECKATTDYKSTKTLLEKAQASELDDLNETRYYPRSRSPDNLDVPGYMKPLDRSLRPNSPHRSSVTDIEETVSKTTTIHETVLPEVPTPASKFGVTLRRTDSGNNLTTTISSTTTSTTATTERKKSLSSILKNYEIEEIYELDILEELLETTVGYDLRRRIRAQIRSVKNLISEDKLKIINLKPSKFSSPSREAPVFTKKPSDTRSPTRQVPETKMYNRKPSETNFTEYQTKYILKSSADSKAIDNHLYDHTNLVDSKDVNDKTEYQSSYSKKSSATKNYTLDTDGKPRNKSPVKSRETSPETKPCRRGKSPEKPERQTTSKYFQTELKKVSSSTKSTKDDKPDWVTKRILRKITDNPSPVAKKYSSSTTKTTVTKEIKSSGVRDSKPTDVITSSYGVGPIDENGSPLFGLKALRTQNNLDQSKVQGTVVRSQFYSENGHEPVGEISVTKYSTDPADLSSDEEITREAGLLSKTTTQKFGHKGTPSYKSVIDRKQFSEIENDNRTKKSMTKVTRRGSVKEITQKFLENTVDSLKSEKQAYPKAGLILRTSSFKDKNGSPTEEHAEESTVTTVCTSSTKTTSGGQAREGQTFLTNKNKVTGMQDIVSRMQESNKETREGDSFEDTEARSLLNKFLGSQVILSGIEGSSTKASNKSSSTRKATTKISTTITEGGKPRTVTRTFTHPITAEDIADICDEEALRLLLEQSSDYDERRVLRARLKEVMAEKEESYESTKQSFTESPVTTTQVSATKVLSQQQVSKKPMSPFAKFRQLDRANSLNTPPSTPKTPGGGGGGAMFKFTDPQLSRSASTIKERLLQWCQMKTKEYENIQLDNFSGSWADGLAFCALIHHFLPDSFDYSKLTPNNRRYNFTLAFQIADEKADIAPLLDVDDMVATRRPDWKCVFTYVQSIYRRFKDED